MKGNTLIEKFKELVTLDSESGKEREFALHLQKELEALGFVTHFDQTQALTGSNSGNLYARREGRPDRKSLIFSCHMDTVSPGVGIKPVVLEDRITSDGSTILGSDDKAGIAVLLEVVKELSEEETGTLEFFFSVKEEQGLKGAYHGDRDWFRGSLLFVLDASGRPGKAVLKAPAQKTLIAEVFGKAAHAGSPDGGISAIAVMSDAVSRMKLLRIDEETTANLGMIEGGRATNIVADYCKAVFEARSHSEQKLENQLQHMVEALQSSCDEAGATLSLEIFENYPALQVERDSAQAKLFAEACEALHREPEFIATGGGSDANVWQQRGLSSIVLTTGMQQVHTNQEFILKEDLECLYDIVREIIIRA